MKKFEIREVETVKTTAALYHCSACPWQPWCRGIEPPIDATA